MYRSAYQQSLLPVANKNLSTWSASNCTIDRQSGMLYLIQNTHTAVHVFVSSLLRLWFLTLYIISTALKNTCTTQLFKTSFQQVTTSTHLMERQSCFCRVPSSTTPVLHYHNSSFNTTGGSPILRNRLPGVKPQYPLLLHVNQHPPDCKVGLQNLFCPQLCPFQLFPLCNSKVEQQAQMSKWWNTNAL